MCLSFWWAWAQPQDHFGGVPMVDRDSPSSPPNRQVLSAADFITPVPESERPALTSAARQVDFSPALEFLTLLDPDPNALFTFQTFDDSRTEPKRAHLTKVLHATRDQLPAVWPKLALLNAGGAGVFVTVNRTNGRGRKGSDITRVRALYVDLDGAPLEPVLSSALPPHIVVATSPGKFHCYWLVGGMPLEDFRGAQEALIDAFGSDRNVKSIEHVMRVPAFMHRKGEPFLVNIHSKNERPLYRADEFPKTVQP